MRVIHHDMIVLLAKKLAKTILLPATISGGSRSSKLKVALMI